MNYEEFTVSQCNTEWCCSESGPSATYSVSPVRILQSRVGTMSSRLSLVLTSANAASMFTCVASHPTLVDSVGRQTVRFMLPRSASELVHAQGRPSAADYVQLVFR